jgi:hypothetical protein
MQSIRKQPTNLQTYLHPNFKHTHTIGMHHVSTVNLTFHIQNIRTADRVYQCIRAQSHYHPTHKCIPHAFYHTDQYLTSTSTVQAQAVTTCITAISQAYLHIFTPTFYI